MITRTNAYVTSDKQTFAELESAIGHELVLIFADMDHTQKEVVEMILKNRDKIVDLLTTTSTSKSRARKVNGGTKKRTPKPNAAAAGSP